MRCHKCRSCCTGQKCIVYRIEDNADYQILQAALLKKNTKRAGNGNLYQTADLAIPAATGYEMALRQLIAQDKRIKDDGSILFNTANTFWTIRPTHSNQAFEYC